MKERPILFNSEMVNAILGGRKSMTRRVIKPQPRIKGGAHFVKCPYGAVGDVLRVRETWARIWLEITDVRVERVQDISEDDAINEGVSGHECEPAKECFIALWDSIYSIRGHGWDSNPWVWVVEFKRIDLKK